MYKQRHIQAKLEQLVNYFKVVLVVGARQVGKSTLLKTLYPQLQHLTFDPIQDLYGARQDPDLFLNNFPRPIILDEMQYIPNLLPAIKRKVDESDAKSQYLLTGSQNISILKTIAESLAGRVGILHLGGFTPFELADTPQNNWLIPYLQSPETFLKSAPLIQTLDLSSTLYTLLWRGSYPGLLDIPNEFVASYYSSYIQTYVERDVRLLENIQDLSQFDRFLGISAALTAQEINYSHLGREIALMPATANRWMDLLVHTYLWAETAPFSGNLIKRVSKKSKGYFTDTGLICYLQRISTPDSLARHPLLGSLFESFCVNFIQNICDSLSMSPKFYHWRTAGGAEVDLILELDGRLYPIEIKCKSNLTAYDARGIRAFFDAYPALNIAPGIILYTGDRCYALSDKIFALPWNALGSAHSPS